MRYILKILTTCLGLCENSVCGGKPCEVRAWQNLSGAQAQFAVGALDAIHDDEPHVQFDSIL